ncbi:DUF1740-domain-containing protein [Hypoxylon sp. NC1633]|nr:DUF1740-domain-containing protein [Hypoxylon sp. NC1633]
MSSKQGKASIVPKFSSFKPKLEAAKIQSGDKPDEPSQRGEPPTSQKQGRRHSSKDPSRHTDKTHHLTSHHQQQKQNQQQQQQPSSHEQDRDALFFYDKRGDPLIWRYGGNDRREIPHYRRLGSGRILGADGYMRIDHSRNRDEFFIQTYHEGRSLLGSDKKTILAKGGHHKSIPIRVRRDQPQTGTTTEDFVPLTSSRKRKRGGAESEDPLSEGEPSYRSILGKGKIHEHSDSDADSSSIVSSTDLAQDPDPAKLKTTELTRKALDHPKNIDAWIELVDHQDTLLGRDPTAAEVKSYADIKLSMLEQAYPNATTDPQREVLQLRIMREGLKIWDAKTISRRWEKALEEHGSSSELWKGYINFQQSRLSTFQYENIKQLYIQQLRRLEMESLTKKLDSDRLQIYEKMVYLFLRATRFISDAGYAELAVATWQATLELTFARPSPPSNQPPEVKIPPSFLNFWETEVPRIGEEAAQGWAAFERSGGTIEPPEPKTSDVSISPTTRDGFKAWSIVEQHRSRAATNPARTLDDGAEDDPYRVVMFADIQDLILYLPTKDIPHIQNLLLDAFLMFCQLPPAFSSIDAQDMLRDVFLIRDPASLIISEEQNTKTLDFSHDYSRMNISPEVLFPLPRWFTCMKKIRDDVPADQYQWIATTLKQLVHTFGVRDLAPYYLSFHSLNEPGNEKKTAKALLKQDPTNAKLYLGYSILEWAKGNKDSARNTLAAATSLKSISIHHKVFLGVAAAWMGLEDCDLAKSVLQLCALSNDDTSTPPTLESPAASAAQILKGRQFLSSNREYLSSSGDVENAVIYAEGLTLLEYLTRQSNKEPSSESQGDIWSAIAVVSDFSDELVSRGLASSSPHERLLQSAARLLYHHAIRGPFRLGFLHEQLSKYISFFPRNTIFLNLFAWREARLSIDDRVRSELDKVVLLEPNDCVTSRVFAIRHEARTGNVNTTRAAFERALESEACKNHPGLWISYIRFCHESQELRSKAKSVFYRALQCCPWSKEVFMEAFATLARDMDSSELKSVYNALCDKGLRVHVEMEEFVEKWRKEQKGRDRPGQ